MVKHAPIDALHSASSAWAAPYDTQARLTAWACRAQERLARAQAVTCHGRVESVSATLIVATIPRCAIGHLCELQASDSAAHPMLAEVIGFDGQRALLAPLGSMDGIAPCTPIRASGMPHSVCVGPHLRGQVLDGFGRPMRPGPPAPAAGSTWRRVLAAPPPAADRPSALKRLATGVRAVDALLTLARGQRVGLIAGPGCGKTTLLAALARGVDADAIVFALVGERGRELNALLERELPAALARRTVTVCATSDTTPMERVRAAFTATAIAEGLSGDGKHVLLLVDSLTRLARAQREIGLASNEPPGRSGYPSSVYAMLPRLIERAGERTDGSITGIYTVLTETEHGDPIGDEAKSLLDAHIVLSRKLAERGHFPAVDIVASQSRMMSSVATDRHLRAAERARMLWSRHADLEWLLALGEYEPGQDAEADEAIARHPRLIDLLRQDTRTPALWENMLERLYAAVDGP